MLEPLITIVAIALVGSLGVPVVLFTLARLGYFEPIRLKAFGRTWNFAPDPEPARDNIINAAIVFTFPFQRQTIFASVVTAAYTVAAPAGPIDGMRHLETGAAVIGLIRDGRKVA
jgi:hypothetical protein